jgi:hypothetical protein
MEKLLLIAVDCDLRCQDVGVRQGSLEALLEVFAEKGAAGHTTWFLNENDFALTQNHEAFLQEAVRRGDAIGIHDHIDFLKGQWEYGPIYDYCRRSRDAVQGWLRAHQLPDALPYHRAGCLFQHPAQYAALRDLGYTVLSDVYPGDMSLNHTGFLSYDNREVPLGIAPYRHDPENFLDYHSQTGCFLHVPVVHMYIYCRDFVGEALARWTEAFQARGVECGAMAWCFHPYELLNRGASRVSRELVRLLRRQLDELVQDYGVTFASLEVVARRLG